MINTFHSSSYPPPVPPRQGHRGPMIPGNTPLVKFLSVMMLLLMILTFGGFFYLFHVLNGMQYRYSDTNLLLQLQQCKPDSLTPEQREYCKKLMDSNNGLGKDGRVAFLSGRGLSTSPVAQLFLKRETPNLKGKDQLNTLYWDQEHSLMKEIYLNSNGVVTIDQPGYYFLYSQVSFSKGHPKIPLTQVLWTRKSQEDNWEKLLISYCSLSQINSVPTICTASQAGMFELQKSQQLRVNVTSRDLVNAESSTFGLFKLQD
ncbi:CD40 ligand [Salminus brasiliensis]|uniref:CD40 ligand n=1 Tax=Salminus brasiliensis TaxID=930266 RepID=UPI003B837C52